MLIATKFFHGRWSQTHQQIKIDAPGEKHSPPTFINFYYVNFSPLLVTAKREFDDFAALVKIYSTKGSAIQSLVAGLKFLHIINKKILYRVKNRRSSYRFILIEEDIGFSINTRQCFHILGYTYTKCDIPLARSTIVGRKKSNCGVYRLLT